MVSIYITGRIEGQPVRAKENKNGQIEVYLAGKKINDIKTKDKIKGLEANQKKLEEDLIQAKKQAAIKELQKDFMEFRLTEDDIDPQRYEFINPNDCWSLDFMDFKWKGKKLYLSFILDDHSRYILDWGITSSVTFEFVKDLLSKNFK